MPDISLLKVDLTTPQPDGRKGESPLMAFTKHNHLIDALMALVHDSGTIGAAVRFGDLETGGIVPAGSTTRDCFTIPSLMTGRGMWRELVAGSAPNAPGGDGYWLIEMIPYSGSGGRDLCLMAYPLYHSGNVGPRVCRREAGAWRPWMPTTDTVTTSANGTVLRTPGGWQSCQHSLPVVAGVSTIVEWTLPASFLSGEFWADGRLIGVAGSDPAAEGVQLVVGGIVASYVAFRVTSPVPTTLRVLASGRYK